MPAFAGLTALIAATLPNGSVAHPLAPALLELRETAGGNYEVLWRISRARAQRADATPRLPDNCAEAAPRRVVAEESAVTWRWAVDCGELAGQALGVDGLAGSGINAIVRIARPGIVATALLDAATPVFVVPAAPAAPAVLGAYLTLGAKHLLLGFDHLLFVAGLVLLLAGRLRVLVWTVTAFTLGHSITLSLAALNLVAVNAALMELGIALSILVLAVELAAGARDSLLRRHPAAMAGAFGLLHGLGFASALTEAGLPAGDIPLALFAFNLGIELGQLAAIAGLLALAAAARRLPPLRPALARGAFVYLLGSLAAYWCFERAAAFI